MIKIFIAIAMGALITACGEKVPSCGDPKVIDMVKTLITEKSNTSEDPELKKFINDRLSIEISNAIVVTENEKLGKRECKAAAKYTPSEDELKNILSGNGNDELRNDVGFRWRLMSGALNPIEYTLLEAGKVKAEEAGDKNLAAAMSARWEFFLNLIGAKDNPAALLMAMMNPKIQSEITKAAQEQQAAFVSFLDQLDKNKGSVSFFVSYKIEKTEDKKNPILITAEWDEEFTDGIVLGILWQKAFQDRKEFISAKK